MNRSFISYSHRGDGPEWKAALLRAPGGQSLLKQLTRQANTTEHRNLCQK